MSVPLFVSRRTLVTYKRLPRAAGRWALDSGGFSELSMFGAWQTTPEQYVGEVRRYRDEIGGMDWAAAQDWMCEPFMLAKTGLTIAEHQRRTTDNYARLLDLAPDLPWLPVLQGWRAPEYIAHAEAYERRGLPLRDRVVGIGSVCRRQREREGYAVVLNIAFATRLQLHGFGVKVTGLRRMAPFLASADSLAWSYAGRRAGRHTGCAHASGANCLRFATAWRERVLATVQSGSEQQRLPWPS